MSEIYLENHFNKTDKAKGNTLYLVARTISNFGKAMEGALHSGNRVAREVNDAM
jgi:hypothetical protein